MVQRQVRAEELIYSGYICADIDQPNLTLSAAKKTLWEDCADNPLEWYRVHFPDETYREVTSV